jgi:hypothetical protein
MHPEGRTAVRHALFGLWNNGKNRLARLLECGSLWLIEPDEVVVDLFRRYQFSALVDSY